MRTRASICRKKARFALEENACAAALRAGLMLLPYRCDRCRQFHLTSRTRGKPLPRRLHTTGRKPGSYHPGSTELQAAARTRAN